MKYNSTQNDGSRRGSRGPRRNSGHNSSNGGHHDRHSGGARPPRERSNYGSRDTAPAPAPTFWQKVLGIFGIKKKTSTPLPSSAPRARQEGRPERPPYRSGETRVKVENSVERTAEPTRQSRKPELIEVSSPKLYIGNLSYEAVESDLSELFNGVGQVRSAEIVSNSHTQRSKGFAFVTMETVDEAKRAVVELHDQEFMGRKLVVSGAKTSDRPERAEA